VTNVNNFGDIFKFSKEFKTLDNDKQKVIIENMLEENPEIQELVNKFVEFITCEPNINKIKKTLDYFEELKPLLDKLEKLKIIAKDSVTLRKIKNIYNSELTDLESFRKQIEEIETRLGYRPIHQNKITNCINYNLPQLKVLSKNSYIKIDNLTKCGEIQINDSNGNSILNYELIDFDNNKPLISSDIGKLLTFIIFKLNGNTSNFTVQEYIQFRKLSKMSVKTYSSRILKQLSVLKCVSNIKYKDIKNRMIGESSLIIDWKHEENTSNILVIFNTDFVANLKEYYYYLPNELSTISDKNFPHAWVVGCFIWEQLRQNPNKFEFDKDGTISIYLKIKSCLNRTTLPKKEDVTDRHYQKRIIEPFSDTIDELSKQLKDLFITYEDDYKNINEFLEGYIIVNFTNKEIINKYCDIDKQRKIKSIKHNTDKKSENIKLCKQYSEEGKTDKEISKLMNKTMRTIRTYKMEIKSENENRKSGK
jgi:hypothetical protein